jgi:hypothetical protein
MCGVYGCSPGKSRFSFFGRYELGRIISPLFSKYKYFCGPESD